MAYIIGNIAGSIATVPSGPLYYRILEKDKLEALKVFKFNYDTYLTLPDNFIFNGGSTIFNKLAEPDLTIYADASFTG